MGMRKGASDLVLLHLGKFYVLELKAKGEKPTESQIDFMDDVVAAGGYAKWCDNLDDALRWLEEMELIKGKSG